MIHFRQMVKKEYFRKTYFMISDLRSQKLYKTNAALNNGLDYSMGLFVFLFFTKKSNLFPEKSTYICTFLKISYLFFFLKIRFDLKISKINTYFKKSIKICIFFKKISNLYSATCTILFHVILLLYPLIHFNFTIMSLEN